MKQIFIIIKKDLRKVFLDKRALFSTIILPGLILFLIYSIMGQVSNSTTSSLENKASRFLIAEETPGTLASEIEQILDQLPVLDNSKIECTNYRLDDLDQDDLVKKIKAREGDLGIIVLPNGIDNLPTYIIVYDKNDLYSAEALVRFQTVLEATRAPSYIFQQVIDTSADKGDTLIISMIAPMIIVMMIISGAMAICADSIAGEKERKTIGLLLLAPLKRRQVALAKVGANSIIALATSISSFIGLAASLPMSKEMFAIGEVSYQINDYFLILLILVISSLFIVSLLTFISTFAKTTKEATALITPVYLAGVVASIIPSLTGGIPATSSQWAIPVYNTTLALKSILAFEGSYISLLITVISNLVLFLVMTIAIAKLFKKENILFN